MDQITLTFNATSVDMGPLVPACGNVPALQSLRMLQGDTCVCVVHLVWPEGPQTVLAQATPRHAGPQD
jgi:hypothetical protein